MKKSAALAALSLLCAGESKAQHWTFLPTGGTTNGPIITNNSNLGWAFDVAVLDSEKLVLQMCIAAPNLSVPDRPLDFSGTIQDGSGKYYYIIDIGRGMNAQHTPFFEVKPGSTSAWFLNDRPTSLFLPDTMTNIGDYAFSTCSNLVDVVIPDSVLNIGAWAFHSCTKLVDLSIGKNVQTIGDLAFHWCVKLPSVEIPDSVVSIKRVAFGYDTGLTNVVIGAYVEFIGDLAFGWCTNITSMAIPATVTNIDERAFYWCSNLNAVYFDGDAPEPSTVPLVPSYYIYELSNLVTSYVHFAYVDSWTNSPTFTGSFEEGHAYWQGKPIVCVDWPAPFSGAPERVVVTLIEVDVNSMDVTLDWDVGRFVSGTVATNETRICFSHTLSEPLANWDDLCGDARLRFDEILISEKVADTIHTATIKGSHIDAFKQTKGVVEAGERGFFYVVVKGVLKTAP